MPPASSPKAKSAPTGKCWPRPPSRSGTTRSSTWPPPSEDNYVSRAGHKLAGALDAFPAVEVAGKRCLDAGASTGGFTDVLLRRGADHVVAVDVGHDQLVPAIRNDPRVVRPRRPQRPLHDAG